MTTFPTLNPSSRTFTPGGYPHTTFAGISGKANRVRNSNVMLESQLRLTFVAISEAQMLSVLTHYQGQRGGFDSFPLPADVWSGVTASDFQLSGYGWVYTEPPIVEDLPCGEHNVELTLQTVPPEGTALSGLNLIVRYSIAGGRAAAANGAALTIGYSISGGRAGLPGLAQAVTYSIAGGDATGGASVPGLSLFIVYIVRSQPNGLASGLAQTLTYGLVGGTANGNTDINFASRNLLVHFDGSNGGTTFTDNSSNAFTLTRSGTVATSTAQLKYGTAAGDFTAGGQLLTPTSSVFTYTGDFTFEFWAYRTGNNGSYDTVLSANSDTTFFVRGSGADPGVNVAGTRVAGSLSFTLNTWHHIAIVRNGTSVSVYKDGTIVNTAVTVTGTVTMTALRIGNSSLSSRNFKGFIDDFRASNRAEYTANFTPPTAAFPDS